MKNGDNVCFLDNYNLKKGVVEFIGKKIKIKTTNGNIYRVDPEKVVLEDEIICVVWEQWKGVNGRGGYRLEKSLYKGKQRKAKNWPFQALVWEDSYGKESSHNDIRL